MYVNGKCLPVKEHVEACIRSGATSIELHLMKSYYDQDYIPDNVIVTAIHPSNSTYYLTPARFAMYDFKDDVSYLYNLCRYYKDKQDRTPAIILHMQDSVSNNLALSLVEVVDEFNRLYGITPKILIENIVPYGFNGEFNNGFYTSPVRFANLCNQASPAHQFGTCLDLSHAIGSMNIVNALGINTLKLEDYFYQYADSCKLIHLNSGSGFVLRSENMRLPIEDWFIYYFYNMYKKLNFKADITIDVKEDDYSDYANFGRMFKTLNEAIKTLK